MLSVNNIEVIYDHVVLVLKGVSLNVPRGGVVALLGANGAGKTTLFKMILGQDSPDAGQLVVVNGAGPVARDGRHPAPANEVDDEAAQPLLDHVRAHQQDN